MVFDAHDKAFAFFGGACARGIYDNMKTAVDTILVGKDRIYTKAEEPEQPGPVPGMPGADHPFKSKGAILDA